jgi:hypothetical protein
MQGSESQTADFPISGENQQKELTFAGVNETGAIRGQRPTLRNKEDS